MNNCQKCESDSRSEREADRRTLSICLACRDFAYEERRTVGPYEVIVDEIAESVAARGRFETPTVILINTAFRAEPDLDSHTQMNAWAGKHLIRFDYRGDITVFERDGIALGELMRGQ